VLGDPALGTPTRFVDRSDDAGYLELAEEILGALVRDGQLSGHPVVGPSDVVLDAAERPGALSLLGTNARYGPSGPTTATTRPRSGSTD
jgi:hypothetical protein